VWLKVLLIYPLSSSPSLFQSLRKNTDKAVPKASEVTEIRLALWTYREVALCIGLILKRHVKDFATIWAITLWQDML